MKELFDDLPRVTHADFFLDTCFLYYVFTHQKEKELISFCQEHVVALTSFNIKEVLFHSHDVTHVFRERFRHFIKIGGRLFRYEMNVSPGDRDGEKEFINSFNSHLLELIPDPSDAVLVVAAMKSKTNILTRDKHHLFTSKLNNYLEEFNIEVLNNFTE